MFAEPTEVMFLEECCNFTLDPSKASTQIFLQQTYSQLIKGKKNILLSSDISIVEQCILERLKIGPINPSVYLVMTLKKVDELDGKPWYQTQEVQMVISYIKQLVSNYLMTVTIYPDEFSPQRIISEREQGQKLDICQGIARLFDVFDVVGFDEELFQQFINVGVYEPLQLHQSIIQYVRFCVINLTIFADQLQLYFAVFDYYLSNNETRDQILNNQISKWNIKSDVGEKIELEFFIGPLLTISLLQNNEYVIKRAHSELKGRLTKKQFETILRNYQKVSFEYTTQLTSLFKKMLGKTTFQQTIEFIQNVCNANRHKLKDGYQLNEQSKISFKASTDGFVLNLYDIFLDLSRKIVSRLDDTYQKIDFNYWYTLPFPKDQMCLTLSKNQQLNKQNLTIGNVSNFFFYTLKLLQLGLLPPIQELKNLMKQIEESKGFLGMIKNTPQEQMFKQKIEAMEAKTHQYEIVLFNSGRIKDTVMLQDTLIYFLIQQINANKFIDGQSNWQPSQILYYLPEYLISDAIIEVIEFYLSHFEGYSEFYMTNQKFIQFIELSVYILTLPMVTNKYLSAKFLETIFLYTKVSKKNFNFAALFDSNQVVRDNFLIGLLRYYALVGETGSNRQFYAKFQYRFYMNDLIVQLMQLTSYKQQLIRYKNSQECERLIKLMTSDMNHSFEEIQSHVKTYLKTESEQPNDFNGQINKKRQLDFIQQQCKSNLQTLKSNLKLLVELSNHIPEIIVQDVFRDQIISMMNYYLDQLLSKTKQVKKNVDTIKKLGDKDFKLIQFIQWIGQFYANVCHIQNVATSVIQDHRSFKIQYFMQILKTLKQNIAGNQDKVEKFEQFVEHLQHSGQEIPIDELIDIPDKYQDPIVGTLIKDPVRLPKSGTIMDRAVIKASLLEKQLDPFTNTPLIESQLIPEPLFKKEIEEWIKQHEKEINEKRIEKIKSMKEMTSTQMLIEQDEDDEDEVFQGKRYQDDD